MKLAPFVIWTMCSGVATARDGPDDQEPPLLFLTVWGLKDNSTSPTRKHVSKSAPCRTYRSGATYSPSRPAWELSGLLLPDTISARVLSAAPGPRDSLMQLRDGLCFAAVPLQCLFAVSSVSYAANAVALLGGGTLCTAKRQICTRRWLKCCFCL